MDPDQHEVLVVDDASTDGTADLLETSYPWVRLIRRSSNGGFGPTCNTGMEAARGKWILFLNDDMSATPAAIPTLMTYAGKVSEDVFTIRPRIVRHQLLEDDSYRRMAMGMVLRRGMVRFPSVSWSPELKVLPRSRSVPGVPGCSAGACSRASVDSI